MIPVSRIDGGYGGSGDEDLVHVLGGAAGRYAHPDAEAVVVGVAEHERLLGQLRCVLGDHLRVHHESAGGNDDRLCFDRPGFGELLPRSRRSPRPNRPRSARWRRSRSGSARPGLPARLSSRSITMLAPPVSPGTGTLCPRGAGTAFSQERPHLLVAGEHQSLGVGLNHRLAREVAALELKTQVLQPIEVLDAAVAVGANLGRGRARATPRPGTCTSPRPSRDDRSPAGPRCRHPGRSGRRPARSCRLPRRRVPAPAPVRRRPPRSPPRTHRRCRNRSRRTSTSSDHDVTVSASTVAGISVLTAAPV